MNWLQEWKEDDVVGTSDVKYLDLSKVFDTLNFYILINKLKFYGITCTPLEFLDNYLRNRHQFVAFNLVYRNFELKYHKGQI